MSAPLPETPHSHPRRGLGRRRFLELAGAAGAAALVTTGLNLSIMKAPSLRMPPSALSLTRSAHEPCEVPASTPGNAFAIFSARAKFCFAAFGSGGPMPRSAAITRSQC